MQSPDSQEISKRFFKALQYLKEEKLIRGKQTFTTKYGINQGNFYQFEKDISKDIFQAAWLTYLVRDYNISAHWLLTGEGTVFTNNLKPIIGKKIEDK